MLTKREEEIVTKQIIDQKILGRADSEYKLAHGEAKMPVWYAGATKRIAEYAVNLTKEEDKARLIERVRGMKKSVIELFPGTDVSNPTTELAEKVMMKDGYNTAVEDLLKLIQEM